MKVELKGFNVLITGASSGMGFEMAKELLQHGATVVLAARGGEKLQSAYNELNTEDNDVYAAAMDITNEDSVAETADWVRKNLDHLDMLVNNAGIGDNAPGMENVLPNHSFYEVPVPSVKAVVETNFVGYYTVMSKFMPVFVEQGYGRVVYVSASTETLTRKGQVPYGPSKAAGEAMTAIMAEELKGTKIWVNTICPGGFTDTNMAGKGVKELFKKYNLPILAPNVMNKAILFLASSEAEGITGEKFIGKDMDQWLEEHSVDIS